jgi:hypothetical protein
MRKARATAAESLKQDPSKSHPSIDAVVDYFEQLGLLVRREVIDAEFAWDEFYESFFHYYHLDAMWEGSYRKPDWCKTGVAHSFSPKEHANGYA